MKEYKAKFTEVCRVYQPKTIAKKSLSSSGKYPVYGANGKIGFHNEYNHAESELLLGCRGSVGSVHISEPFSWINGNAMVVKPDESVVLKDFVKYALLGGIKLSDAISGTAQPQITRESLSKILIPIYSLEKQKAIVQTLDKTFAEIEQLKKSNELELKRIKSELFSTFRSQILLKYAENTSKVEFGSIGNFVRGPFGGSLKKNMFVKSGFAIYEQQHAIYDDYKTFRYFISQEKYAQMQRFKVSPGDLIMSCSGTYGKISVVPTDAPEGIINQALLKITPDEGISSEYIKNWMQSDFFQKELEAMVGGTALQNVPPVSVMKKISMKVPSLDMQIRIIEELESIKLLVDDLIDNRIEKNLRIKELKIAILANLFSQKEVA